MTKIEQVIINDRWFLSTERHRIITSKEGNIYCYQQNQVEIIASYLKQRQISYYVRFEDFYWVVKFDKEYKEE